MHAFFKLQLIDQRTEELLKKFAIAKRHHDLISNELKNFKKTTFPKERKLLTIFDKILHYNNSSPDQGEH